jgi:hypothetical protein
MYNKKVDAVNGVGSTEITPMPSTKKVKSATTGTKNPAFEFTANSGDALKAMILGGMNANSSLNQPADPFASDTSIPALNADGSIAGPFNLFRNESGAVESPYGANTEVSKDDSIYMILKMLEQADIEDDGYANGSVYNDPEVAEMLKSIGNMDDGSNYSSINRDIQGSTGAERQRNIGKMKSLHKKGIEKDYDKYKNPNTSSPDPNLGPAPKDKPEYISNKNWSKIKQLNPKTQAAVCKLYEKAHEKGLSFDISSGLRTHEQQEKIYATARKGYAAKPGSSQHELGNAIDIQASASTKQALGKIWKNEMGYKWGQTFSKAPEDWHFDTRSA